MRKSLFLVCFIIVFAILVSACGGDNATELSSSAKEQGETFIEKLYHVDDTSFDLHSENTEAVIDAQEAFLPYLTKEEYVNLSARRLLLMPKEAANKQNNTISVKNLKLEEYERGHPENDEIHFNHSFTLIFTDQNGKESDKVDINGQMTVVATEDGWKIGRYYDSKIPMDKLN